MQYSVGKPGRVIAMRLSEGEELYESVHSVALKEDIRAAAVLVTGGFREAEVVVGPEKEHPIVHGFEHFAGPGEVLGVGTIYWDDKGPRMHLHGAIGKKGQVMVGCPRGGAHTFLVLEITIIEITGVEGMRRLDDDSQMKLLELQ
jgi:predicted DNA-binding protein with PD1-like motif